MNFVEVQPAPATPVCPVIPGGMRVHLVNPSDMSFGTAVITPRWLYVLAAATPPAFGDAIICDETLERLDPAKIQVRPRHLGHSWEDRTPELLAPSNDENRPGVVLTDFGFGMSFILPSASVLRRRAPYLFALALLVTSFPQYMARRHRERPKPLTLFSASRALQLGL